MGPKMRIETGRARAWPVAALLVIAIAGATAVGLADPLPAPGPSASSAPGVRDDDPCGGRTRLLATLNRPTVGYSPCAVAARTVVFEIGYQNQVSGATPSLQFAAQYPQNFLRFGVRPRFEIDVIGPNYARVRATRPDATDVATSGTYDSGAGLKYELPPSGKFTVAIDGLYLGANGSGGFTAGNASVTGNLDVAYSLDATTGIGTTLAFSSTGGYAADGSHARYGLFMPSFVITKQIPQTFQLYGEYVYASKIAPDAGGRAFVDFGLQKLFGPHFEVDAELGNSLTPNAAQRFHYVGVGLGFELR
jgi:hypothetical protein